MATFILMLTGEIVVVMWQHHELSLDKADKLMLHSSDAFAELAHLPSLQVLRVRAGEMLFMPKGTVHMVITRSKCSRCRHTRRTRVRRLSLTSLVVR